MIKRIPPRAFRSCCPGAWVRCAEVFLTPDEVEQLLPALLPLKAGPQRRVESLVNCGKRINHCDAVIAAGFSPAPPADR